MEEGRWAERLDGSGFGTKRGLKWGVKVGLKKGDQCCDLKKGKKKLQAESRAGRGFGGFNKKREGNKLVGKRNALIFAARSEQKDGKFSESCERMCGKCEQNSMKKFAGKDQSCTFAVRIEKAGIVLHK